MAKIHPSAVVSSRAELASDVEIGPFCYIEDDVVLGPGCVLDSHATIKRYTVAGERNFFGQGVVVGGTPQDRRFGGEKSYVRIGNDCIFREYVTIHRASGEEKSTLIGDRALLMAFVHLGHNVRLEDDVTIANNVGVSGHVVIETLANIGGMTGIHQFARIGKVAMVAGMSAVVKDVPPFMITDARNKQETLDINAVGLRRMGVTAEGRMSLHKACKLLFKAQLGLTSAMELVRSEVPASVEVDYLLDFMSQVFRGKNGRANQP